MVRVVPGGVCVLFSEEGSSRIQSAQAAQRSTELSFDAQYMRGKQYGG